MASLARRQRGTGRGRGEIGERVERGEKGREEKGIPEMLFHASLHSPTL